MIDVFLVHDDVERASVIRSAIKANPEFSIAFEGSTGREGLYALQTIHKGHPRLCIVRLNLGDMTGFEFIKQVRSKIKGKVYIVPALEGTEAGAVFVQLMQLELRDPLFGSLPAQEIGKVLAAAAQKCEPDTPETRFGEAYVVTILSARGGTGKSVIATNIAANVAQRTATSGSPADGVSLLDFSWNAGDFAAMLDDVPRNNIMDAVAAGGGIDSELLQNLLATHPRLGFRYLAHPTQEVDVTAFDYNIASTLVSAVKALSSHVIIDTGGWNQGPTVAAVDLSSTIVVVTPRDVPRLMSTGSAIRFFKDRGTSANNIKVLVNQSEIGSEIGDLEIEEVLQHPVTAYIPSNPAAVTYSINSATPIIMSEPNTPISVVLAKIGELVFNKWEEKPVSSNKKPSIPRLR